MSFTQKRHIRYSHVCEACKQVCEETRYMTFAMAWLCNKCFRELVKLFKEQFPNQDKISNEDAVKTFKEFCVGRTKEKVIFT